MIQSVDESVGKILDAISDIEQADNTVVVFTSDNGGLDRNGRPTNNDPLRSGKGYAYEGGIRVPWLWRVPGTTPAGSVSDQSISSIDLVPTLAALVGLDDRPWDGVDITQALSGHALPDRALYWHFPHYRHGPRPRSLLSHPRWKP